MTTANLEIQRALEAVKYSDLSLLADRKLLCPDLAEPTSERMAAEINAMPSVAARALEQLQSYAAAKGSSGGEEQRG